MDSPLVKVVNRRLGEFRDGGTLRRVFVVDILECGHEVWHDVGETKDPYGITVRRRCSDCSSSVVKAPPFRHPGFILK